MTEVVGFVYNKAMPEGSAEYMSKEHLPQEGVTRIDQVQVDRAVQEARKRLSENPPPIGGGAPWLYERESDLGGVGPDAQAIIKRIEGLYARFPVMLTTDTLRDGFMGLERAKALNPTRARAIEEYQVKVYAEIEKRVKDETGLKKPENPFVVEIKKTPEEWITLVRSQLQEFMTGKRPGGTSWLKDITLREKGMLPITDALSQMNEDAASRPVTIRYAGKSETITLKEALEKEVAAVQVLSTRFAKWQGMFAPGSVETVTKDIGAANAVISPDAFKTLATLIPHSIKGCPDTGDLVSRAFHVYRKIAQTPVDPKRAHGTPPNIFAEFADKTEEDQTHSGVRNLLKAEFFGRALTPEEQKQADFIVGYAAQIGFQLMSVWGEAAWGDTNARGKATPASDGTSALMHFETYRRGKARNRAESGPQNTIEGAYPRQLFMPLSRVTKVRMPGDPQVYYMSELLDAGRPLRDIDLLRVEGQPNPDSYWLLKLGHAANLFLRLMDTTGKDADSLQGFQNFNDTVRKGMVTFDEVVQLAEDSGKGAEYWKKNEDLLKRLKEKWSGKIKRKYLEGLKWSLQWPGGKLDGDKFWQTVLVPAEDAGTISGDDEIEIASGDYLGKGFVKIKKLFRPNS